jgi:predicted enzyme related to lactoylglutathione lyase
MATIVHFDVPAEDQERAQKFYASLFDWKFEKMPGPMEYYGITTNDDSGKEGVGGGMGKRQAPGQGIVNYIGVSSVDESLKKVEKMGGKILMAKTAVPGFGYLALCLDTENNTFGLWETDESASP